MIVLILGFIYEKVSLMALSFAILAIRSIHLDSDENEACDTNYALLLILNLVLLT